MIMFWSVAALMVLVAMALVLVPLWRKGRIEQVDRNAINVALYKDRLLELEQERTEGTLTDEQFATAHQELERDLLQNVEPRVAAVEAPARSGRGAIIGLALLLPLAAVPVYLQLGSPDFVAHEPGTVSGADQAGDMTQMVEQLQARLKRQPDDAQGWVLLGRSLAMQQRYGAAADAYAEALKHAGENAELLSYYAEALAMQQGGLQGKPEQMLARALALDPDSELALWLSGIAAFEREKFAVALGHWQRLLPMMEAGSEWAQMVSNGIEQAKARLAGAPAVTETPVEATAAEPVRIVLDVSVAAALTGKVAAGDTLFVYALDPQGGRMPIAIERHLASELPLTVTLDDGDTMAGGRSLSSFQQLRLMARISKSGTAMAASGDLQGEVMITVGSDDHAVLNIDQALP